ncbi:KPN_02809 family neutral zinc metallopeptidase [Mucilaginibacter myungsuensis]|uniref:Zinc metallopeptidase n=1 Tax=Mucilaginibacter myungsuensis TaxID=649104 RepID=A0A929KWE6_9SPHI|nr:neutral zinc metallopeptidase [Mucilaginibacter myungsuensis]MBE9661163.1 zinc metallopeptidase [Mucilaginibacter myungsuensis]MDN3597308.1 neutral zinc metallopeptidase [Mucilaginibacter myungsuensis]
MKWFGGRESNNVEQGSGGGGRGLAFGGGIIGLIGAVIYMFTGINPAELLNGSGQPDQSQQTTKVEGNISMDKRFVRVVVAGTEDVWDSLFVSIGKTYEHPTLQLFTDEVNAEGCGYATSATGPFYCPANRRMYLDMTFFDDLSQRFGAPGDAAKAYVIAHEVGHHVQNLLGVTEQMDRARSQMSETQYNKLSVALELQADFYAGVWAHYEQDTRAKGIVISRSDIDSALVAANAIGDDRLQQQGSGHVNPDSFTHGTSAQRAFWFKKGFDTGDIRQGDTFAALKREEY